MPEAVILEVARTPFGKRGGAFREVRPGHAFGSASWPVSSERPGSSPRKSRTSSLAR